MWSAQAEAEGLTLLVSENKAGYFGVKLDQRARTKPYEAQVRRGGKMVHLGIFATAEEAALVVEGHAEVARLVVGHEQRQPLRLRLRAPHRRWPTRRDTNLADRDQMYRIH